MVSKSLILPGFKALRIQTASYKGGPSDMSKNENVAQVLLVLKVQVTGKRIPRQDAVDNHHPEQELQYEYRY